MRLLFASIILLFLGCVSTQPASSRIEPSNSAECKIGEFRGEGIGDNKEQALDAARSDLAKQINSSIEVLNTSQKSQQIFNGNENIASKYESEFVVKANLQNAHDISILQVKPKANGKIEAVVCMSRSDAAKGFMERQRLIADSLGIVSSVVINAEHPKRKNEAWHRTQMLITESIRIQNLFDGWGVAKTDLFDYANKTYSQTKDHYTDYCKTAKVFWNPEQENIYSEIAFAKLSQNLIIEKSLCVGNGISLVYKETVPNCSEEHNIYRCFYKPSLSVLSCEGVEYSLLEDNIKGIHRKNEEFALKELEKKLKTEDFLKKWEQEIKQWRPKCE